MLRDSGVFVQTLTGSLFTWGLTALGAAGVFLFRHDNRQLLDGSLGFAAGVMLAASFWSLLAPALEIAARDLGPEREAFACCPVGLGLLLGAAFVYAADCALTRFGLESSSADAIMVATGAKRQPGGVDYYQQTISPRSKERTSISEDPFYDGSLSSSPSPFNASVSTTLNSSQLYTTSYPVQTEVFINGSSSAVDGTLRRRPMQQVSSLTESQLAPPWSPEPLPNDPLHPPVAGPTSRSVSAAASWKRMLLLIIAIVVHNIPEGMVVGVGFAAAASQRDSARSGAPVPATVLPDINLERDPSGFGNAPVNHDTPSDNVQRTTVVGATFEKARHLAIGIGLQNFPEGLAVSLPLSGAGFSKWHAFFWGQLSGMVEPVAALAGAAAVGFAQPILPLALSFAAGAMIFVVVDDIIPETQTAEIGKFDAFRTTAAATGSTSKLASWMCIVGFLVMMTLDVTLS